MLSPALLPSYTPQDPISLISCYPGLLSKRQEAPLSSLSRDPDFLLSFRLSRSASQTSLLPVQHPSFLVSVLPDPGSLLQAQQEPGDDRNRIPDREFLPPDPVQECRPGHSETVFPGVHTVCGSHHAGKSRLRTLSAHLSIPCKSTQAAPGVLPVPFSVAKVLLSHLTAALSPPALWKSSLCPQTGSPVLFAEDPSVPASTFYLSERSKVSVLSQPLLLFSDPVPEISDYPVPVSELSLPVLREAPTFSPLFSILQGPLHTPDSVVPVPVFYSPVLPRSV